MKNRRILGYVVFGDIVQPDITSDGDVLFLLLNMVPIYFANSNNLYKYIHRKIMRMKPCV